MDILTLLSTPGIPLVLTNVGTALVVWYAVYWTRQRKVDDLERELRRDDAIIRDQRDQIAALRGKVVDLHRTLAGEEEAGRTRDLVIDALLVDQAPRLTVVDGAR